MRRVWLEPRWRPVDAALRSRTPLESIFQRERVVAVLGRGRDTLWWIARSLSGAVWTCWVPAFGCRQMVIPFERALHRVRYYDVDEHGRPDWRALCAAVSDEFAAPHLLLVNDAFGYPSTAPPGVQGRISEAFDVVVRDAAHSLPSVPVTPIRGRCGAYTVYSFRKHLGVADGAFVTVPRFSGGAQRDAPALGDGSSLKNTAYLVIEWIGRTYPEFRVTAAYRWSRNGLREHRLGLSMGRLARLVVPRLDLEAVVERRRQNAERFAATLSAEPMHEDHGLACPLYYAVRTRDAQAAKSALQRHGVEAFADWTLEHVADASHRFPVSSHLARTIVGLPVHQDLSDAELAYITTAVELLGSDHFV